MRGLLLSACLMSACSSTPASKDPVALAGHPCPELALPPTESSLWKDAVRMETPVPLALALPLPDGLSVEVSQGNHGAISHGADQAFAYDFDVPLGTVARAAAPGVVVWAEDGHTEYGPDESFREFVNYVVLDHGGGLFTAYVHLAADGVEVMPGDVVAAGDRLGVTGLSGQMTGPHLHFHVENVWSETLPARFVDMTNGGCGLFPQTGERVRGDDLAFKYLVGRDVPSDVPPDTWAENEVVAVTGLPARLYEQADALSFRGEVTLAGATEVVMLFLPPEGGTALSVQRFPVTDGTFRARLDLSDIEPRAYGVALVAGSGGPVSVPRSVLTMVVQ